MTTSLVTGGLGFIGSHVVDHLIRMGHQIVILDDLSGGTVENRPATLGLSLEKPGDAVHENFSIVDTLEVNKLIDQYRPDFVFHLAAYAAEGLSHYIRHYNYEVNVLGSVNLINAAVNYGVKRFVYASSAAVYGDTWPNVPQQEWFNPQPIDPYGNAKALVERDLQLAQKTFGLPYTIFRMHNVYGPRQNLADNYRNVVGIFMRQALQGQRLTIYGDGMQVRQFTYIDDIAPLLAHCIDDEDTANDVFNVGSDVRASINWLADLVLEALGKPYQVEILPERHEMKSIELAHEKSIAAFGPYALTSLGEGVEKMARWAETQTLREPKPFTQIEIEKGLPEHWRKLNVRTTD